jgi:hypothetical protein
MTIGVNSSYQRGLELAEAGRHQEALIQIQEYLRCNPDDAQALNDAGAILHCLGRSREAIDHIVRARSFNGDSAEIIWNLAEAYIAAGEARQAAQLLDDMERMGILNADILNRIANVFLNQNDKANATEILLRSLKMSPQQEVLKPMLQVIRSKRPKIAFICGADGMTFLNGIVDFVKQRFEVKIFEGRTKEELYELMRWSDISWFEWCTDLAVIGSSLPKVCKNIVRLHRYEAYLNWPQQINWQNIDILIMVGNSFVKDALLKQVPNIENITRLISIPNGVNLEKFKFVDRQRGKNIAFPGNFRMVKNPAFVLQCIQKLHYIDPQYRLFFGGIFQDAALEQYVRYMVNALGLGEVVFFDGWQNDINLWLADKHYIVSTSIIESQGMGILEGMACGLKPVIHNFPGSGQIFPTEFLFNISEDFCQQVLSDKYEPYRYRRFVEENYSQKKQLGEINRIFIGYEAETELKCHSGEAPASLSSELAVPAFTGNMFV